MALALPPLTPSPARLSIRGRAEVAFAWDGARTRLGHLFHHDPLRVLFPNSQAGDPPTAVIATTSGGLVGGDLLEIEVKVGAGASALVTAQAAEKVYRSTGADTQVELRLTAEPGAWLEWLPQETILFDGSRLRRLSGIDALGDARVLAGEMLIFGRLARGERFSRGLARDAWEIRRDGRLVWADALHLDGEVGAILDHPACFGGATATATLVYTGLDAGDHLGVARELLGACAGHGGATCLGSVLVVRLLGADAQRLRGDFGRVWAGLRVAAGGWPDRLPRLWHI